MTNKEVKMAVIKTGGKQYLVQEGDVLQIEKLPNVKEGDKVTFDDVLLIVDSEDVKVGEPTVSGAKVEAELLKNDRAKKVSVIRYRAKSRYFKNKGHRQHYSEVKVLKI